MNFNQTFFNVIEEQNILKTTKTKPIVDAIKSRNKISFFYSGPRKPAKNSVKPGNRIDAEAVALGLNKKGNLVVRAYVQPPSVSKKGFDKTGWRTFMVGRMSNLKVSDSKFDQKRPDYKEGDDKSMSVTYVTADWTNKPEVKKPRIVKPTVTKPTPKSVQPQPTEPQPVEPEVKPTEPTSTELPQPTPQTKPTKTPTPPKEPTQPTPEEPKTQELPQPKPQEKPEVNPEEDENKKLQESIKNIKRLMFS
jgi:hypothetical protein